MEKRSEAKTGRMEQRREQRRLQRARTGDSPQKLAERHTPERDWVERWLWSGGIERPNRFRGAGA
jgi:hypothetical protein